jgi:hypothetical protein
MSTNDTWNLQSFIDSLVVELDRARDALAVKAMNQPLSYSVKDLSLDLQVFPDFDGDRVNFKTAKPGEQGASKISMQLVSTSDRAIRESSRTPARMDEGKIDSLPGMDAKQRNALEKIGVRTVKDVERMEKNNVNLDQVTNGEVDYSSLSNMIKKAKRRDNPPLVRGVSMTKTAEGHLLIVDGKNLILFEEKNPFAYINGKNTPIITGNQDRIVVRLPKEPARAMNINNSPFVETCHILLEPDTIIKFDIKS